MVEATAFAVLVLVLAAAAAWDIRRQIVPNHVAYPAIVLGLVGWTAVGAWQGRALELGGASLVAALAAFIPMLFLFTAGGFGGGDVKLMTAVGALSASWQCVLATAVYSLLVGAAMAVVVMIRRRIVWRTLKRIGTAAMIAFARVKPDMPTDSPRIPFAAAVAVGGTLAGVEHLLHVRMPWG